jgi:hypothetical protein
MPDTRDLEEKENELHQRLAPHVEGELLVVALGRAGGSLVQGQRFYGGLLEWLLPKMLNEETGLPLNVWLALTADDVYVFQQRSAKRDIKPPLRRWSRASLRSVETKKFGRGLRVFLTLENGKKAIFLLPASLKDRVHAALGVAGASAGEPDP